MQLMCYKVLCSWVVMATTREGSCKRHVTYTLSYRNSINVLPHEKMKLKDYSFEKQLLYCGDPQRSLQIVGSLLRVSCP